jgi:hypothetical protein
MKKLVLSCSLVLGLAHTSQAAQKALETWNCTGKGHFAELKVSVGSEAKSTVATLVDTSMASKPIELQAEDNRHLTGYVTSGHDDSSYTVELLQGRDEDFEGQSSYPEVFGQAIVISKGFIDCVGTVTNAEVLNCKVSR